MKKDLQSEWEKKQHQRHWDCYVTMKRWLMNRNDGKLIADYFNQCPYKTAAIYGVGDLGKMLLHELEQSNLSVDFFIDRAAEGHREEKGIKVVLPGEITAQKKVDVIIITPIDAYLAVANELSERGIDIPVISLRDIIYEM